jgi:hypothetical protein
MAHYRHKHVLPKKAASAIRDLVPVKESGTKDTVVLAAAVTDHPVGVTIASAASPGDALAVVSDGVVRAVCGASVGAGVDVGVASTNGALGPVVAASGVRRFAVGISQDAAAAGVTFSVLLRPREIPGLGL